VDRDDPRHSALYPGPQRQKVLRLLASVDVAVEAPPEIGGGAGNDDIVRVLAGQRPELLLIPFHVVRNAGGERTTGLELLARLRQEVPRLRACFPPSRERWKPRRRARRSRASCLTGAAEHA